MGFELLTIELLDEAIPNCQVLTEEEFETKQTIKEILQDGETVVFYDKETKRFTAAEIGKPMPFELTKCFMS